MRGIGELIITGVILSVILLPGVAGAEQGSLRLDMNGNTVTITGSTNLAAGNRIVVTVISAAFTPTEKGAGEGFSGASGTVEVQPGTPLNSFRFDVDVSAFPPGLYLVSAESLETAYQASARFVLPWTPVPTTPAPPVPASPALTSTPPPTTAMSPAPQPSPTRSSLPVLLPLGALAAAAIFIRRR